MGAGMEGDLERLARAYRDRLEERGSGEYRTAIELTESAIGLADALMCASRQNNYALSYFRNLKSDTLQRLYALEGERPAPDFRPPIRRGANSWNRLVDLQIELLNELDRKNNPDALREIFRNENRALSLLGLYR